VCGCVLTCCTCVLLCDAVLTSSTRFCTTPRTAHSSTLRRRLRQSYSHRSHVRFGVRCVVRVRVRYCARVTEVIDALHAHSAVPVHCRALLAAVRAALTSTIAHVTQTRLPVRLQAAYARSCVVSGVVALMVVLRSVASGRATALRTMTARVTTAGAMRLFSFTMRDVTDTLLLCACARAY
jgi:hypothetical protein